MTEEGGATIVVPKSHKARRHPTPDEIANSKFIAIETEPGDVAVWDGRLARVGPKENTWYKNAAMQLTNVFTLKLSMILAICWLMRITLTYGRDSGLLGDGCSLARAH